MVNVYSLVSSSFTQFNANVTTNTDKNYLNIILIVIGVISTVFLIAFVIVMSCFVGGVSSGNRGGRVHHHGIGHRGFGRR